MRLRRRYVWWAASLGFALTLLPAVASSVEPTPTIKAVNVPASNYYAEKHYWFPSQQTVMTGGVVTFSNPTPVAHGVEWLSAVKPKCEEGQGKVPVGTTPAASAPEWSGNCTFTQAGTYTFYCTVHGPEMTGTVTVKSEGEPVAVTGVATPVTETGATLNGTVDPEGNKTTYFFKYGRTTSYENGSTPTPPGKLAAVKVSEPVSAPVTGLAPGTTYHFQLVAENSAGTAKGADQTLTTPGPPSATTSAATAVGEAEATLKGTVNPDGKPTKSFFEWGTSESYGQVTAEAPAGEDHFNQAASAILTGLVPGKGYHFRLVAKNASEEVRGADQMFTTTSLSSPPSEPSSPTTTTPPPTTTTHAEPPLGPPIVGSPSLRSTQRGTSVKGSLDVSQAGASGRLEVDLLAKSASLAAVRRSAPVRVGRLVRTSVSAGKVSFSVALTARGKSALRRHHRLALTVKITLMPPKGATVTITRSVTLRS
jgi:plastocyanin